MADAPTTGHRSRYQQVAGVLARHGLGALSDALGLERFGPLQRGHTRPTEPMTQPAHVRLALAELGPTFIKLGQILSTRADLLPPAYLDELAKLQDAAPSVPPETVRAVLVADLGRPPEEVFTAFEATPLAAASIGQAHAATLPDGTAVVVKVRRPGVVAQVNEDLDILQNLATMASRRWERARDYDVVGLAQEFADTLRAELDYLHEGRNAERCAANLATEPTVHIPRVFWETTTSRVLTLERISGLKARDLTALDAAGYDRRALAERMTQLVLTMVFENGLYHADLHPGNLFVEPDGRLGLIDFGLVGTLDERTRDQLVPVLLAVTSQDAARLVDALVDLSVAGRHLDRAALQQEVQRLLGQYYGRPLGEIPLGPLLNDMFAIVRRQHVQLPARLVLLLKTLVMAEGLATQFDPTFQLTSVLTPYAQRLVLQQYAPHRWTRQLGQGGLDAARLGTALPAHLRRLLISLEQGTLDVGVHPTGVEPLMQRAERLANRIVLGILAAAFINGLAVLMSVYHPPGWPQWAGVVFTVGFVVAAGLGAYLAWTILRSGRR